VGPKITRIAVFTFNERTWYPLDLREPVEGRVSSTVGDTEVVYVLGRYIYAFSLIAQRWDVLELPKGAKPARRNFGSTSFEHDGHLYDFNAVTAKWRDIDLRAILDAPEDKPKDDAEPKK
jgi:hypothetical protein